MYSALRPYVTVGVALVGAGIISAPAVAPLPPDVQVRAVRLTSGDTVDAADPTTVSLVMGGSGLQILSPDEVANANEVYVLPHFPGAIPQPLGYPAQLYPLHGAHQGFLDDSEQQGQKILDAAIKTQLADGHHVVVWGTSQSATVETLEMRHLASLPPDEQPSPDQLAFVNYGDPNLPNGGMLDRFDAPGVPDNLTLPSLGITFNGPTPADTPYPTVIYTGEYDGFADFPRYPLNLLADLNALIGIPFVHDHGSSKPASLIDTAFQLETSPGYDGDTTYYLVPTPDLPLLEPLRAVPVVGNPLADLLQPDLTVLVNLGYGPDNVGYSEYPDVFTPFGLFPDVDPATVLDNLVAGAKEGVGNFLADLKEISPSSIMADITSAGPQVTPLDLNPDNFVTELQHLLTVNGDALATLVASPLDNFNPLVDVGTGLGVNLPVYDTNLVLAGLDQLANGDPDGLLHALVDPIAANTGLLSIAAFALLSAIADDTEPIIGAFQNAITEDMNFIAGLPDLFS
jgi:hypothetical protein